MSAEVLLLSAIVDEGAQALRRVYAQGVSADSFAVYDEEFEWIERRLARKKPITLRALREQFPDFEYMRARGETVDDLARELKEECALASMNEIVSSLAEQATKENVIELLVAARDRITQVTRAHSPMSDVDLDEWRPVIEDMRQRMILARQGVSPGILTGIPHIDHHLGGLLPGQFVMVNGRTGSTKSFFVTMLAWAARKQAAKVGIFSPEFNKHEVSCRYHTLASADKDVQRALGFRHSFRNRALMNGIGFNLKSYQRMLEYIDAMPGRTHLLCGTGMKDQMSVGYIEDRIVEYELDLVIVDPIYLLKPVRLHREGNVYQEVAWIGEKLHQLSEQYDIPIVFTNQAHLEGPKTDAPALDKSFGTKSLLHLSDWVLAVQFMSEENKLIVKANKARFGEEFRFVATFLPNTGYFDVDSPLPHASAYYNGSSDSPEEGEEVVRRAVKGRARA